MSDPIKISSAKIHYPSQTGVGSYFVDELIVLYLQAKFPARIELRKTNEDDKYFFHFRGDHLDGHNPYAFTINAEENAQFFLSIIDQYYTYSSLIAGTILLFSRESVKIVRDRIIEKYLKLSDKFEIEVEEFQTALYAHLVQKIMDE